MTDQSPPAGWYPHPSMANTQRYWDGERWTDHIAPQGTPAPGQQPADLKVPSNWRRAVAVLAVLVLLLAAAWYFLGYNSAESKAKRACKDYVTLQLKAPSTAEFSGAYATRNSDDTWHVTGIVDSENGFGAKVRNVYECDVDNDDYSVFGTHFSEDDN